MIVLALLVASCGGGSDDSSASSTAATLALDPTETAATVDGTPIATATLLDLAGDGAGPEELADNLRRLIINQVLEDAVVDFDVAVGQGDEDRAREAIVAEVTGGSGATLEEVLSDAGISSVAFDLIVRQTALASAVELYLADNAPPPRDEDLQALYDEQIGDRANVCAAHILLETRADADSALARAVGGEDFGDLARELSTGPSGPDGGDLGCSSPAAYVAPFAAATLEADVGTAFGPVETQFGFHVILVTDRTVPTLDDVRDELAAALLSDVFPAWLTAQVQAAVVRVDPVFGRWVTDPSPGVVPPS